MSRNAEHINPKAVIEGRIPGKASVGAVIVLVVSALCAVAMLSLDAVGGPSFLTGVALAILPVPVLISLVLKLDPLEPEPWRALFLAFMWGAGVAVLGALIFDTLGMHFVTTPIFGENTGQLVTDTVGAPLVEEILKGAILFAFLRFYAAELDELGDGIIYGALVAIGFAMMENITYYIRAASHHNLEGVFILRGIITPFAHPLFTAMTGLGVAYAAQHRGTARHAAPFVGLLAAIFLHGLWNYSIASGFAGLTIVCVIAIGLVAALVAVVARERRAMAGLIDTYLTPYVADKLVSREDIQMLASPAWRGQAREWAGLHGGRAAARAMGYYQLAATELVLLHKMAERGVTDRSWFDERRAALVDLMRLSRDTYESAVSRTPPPQKA